MTERKDPRVRLWTPWTDADIEALKTMWRAKHSAREIADALSTGERKFTRNAVIGKIDRLGFNGEGGLATQLVGSKKRKPQKEMQPAAPAPIRLTPPDAEVVPLDLEFPSTIEIVEEVEIAVSDRVTLFHLGPGVCKWPIGDPFAADFTFCGGGCDVTQSYCETHHKIAYVPLAKFKTDPRRAYHR